MFAQAVLKGIELRNLQLEFSQWVQSLDSNNPVKVYWGSITSELSGIVSGTITYIIDYQYLN